MCHVVQNLNIFTSFSSQKIDNFLGKSKLNFWTKNEDFEQCDSLKLFIPFITLEVKTSSPFSILSTMVVNCQNEVHIVIESLQFFFNEVPLEL